jgi:hypothetical protein
MENNKNEDIPHSWDTRHHHVACGLLQNGWSSHFPDVQMLQPLILNNKIIRIEKNKKEKK